MASVTYYSLNHIPVGAKISNTMFLEPPYEGQPTAWLLPLTGKWEDYQYKDGYIWEHCDKLLIRTNMSIQKPSKRLSCTDDDGVHHYVTDLIWEALDIGQGSFEACEAIIKLYNS